MINNPTKVFPCDCMGEGLVVVHQEEETDDCEGSPFIEIAFWQIGHEQIKKYTHAGFDLWWRLKLAWRVFRKGMPFEDMVILRDKVAKNFAYHILYLLSKNKKKQEMGEPLVKQNGHPEPIGIAVPRVINGKIEDELVKFFDKKKDGKVEFLGVDLLRYNKLPPFEDTKNEIAKGVSEKIDDAVVDYISEGLTEDLENETDKSIVEKLSGRTGPIKFIDNEPSDEAKKEHQDIMQKGIDDTLINEIGGVDLCNKIGDKEDE